MGALKWAAAIGVLAFSMQGQAQTIARWRPYIDEASGRFSVPASWIERVMRAESRGRTHLGNRPIRSSAGAMGLMQLMPRTWVEVRARLGLGHDPDNPRDNILAGTFYLRLMYDRFGYPGLFAAYNAGPARYSEHLAGRRSLPAETVSYLANVAPSAGISTRPVPPMTIFVVRKGSAAAAQETDAPKPASLLFFTLSQDN